VHLWKHEIANVVDEVYRKGSKLFGDVLWQIVIAVKFNVRFFFIGKLKPKFEGIGARTLDFDHNAELHCHLTTFLLPCPITRQAPPPPMPMPPSLGSFVLHNNLAGSSAGKQRPDQLRGYGLVALNTSLLTAGTPTSWRKKCTTCSGRDRPLR